MHAGPRQRFGPSTVPLTGTLGLSVTGCLGAKLVLVKASGGDSANALDVNTAEMVDLGGTVAGSAGLSLTIVGGGAVGLNFVLPQAIYWLFHWLPVAGANPEKIPLPLCLMQYSVGTADVNNVIFDVWPMFDTTDDLKFSLALAMRTA